MEYKMLRGTGLNVSKACLGTMTFGDQLDEIDSITATHKAMDLGINYIDTANVYTKGRSEEIVGKALKDCRQEVVLASKVGHGVGPGLDERGLGRKHITNEVENTLRRLQTDYLDLYYMHLPDKDSPLEETVAAMESLVDSGKVRYVGISNFPAWKLADLYHLSNKSIPKVTQNVYNLLTRGIEDELLPAIKDRDIGVVTFNPLAGGLLTGKHSIEKPVENTRFSDLGGYYKRYWNEENFKAIDALKTIASNMGISVIELSLRWCISQELVDSVIIGISKLTHLESNLNSINNGCLPEEILIFCDEIWSSLKDNRYPYFQ